VLPQLQQYPAARAGPEITLKGIVSRPEKRFLNPLWDRTLTIDALKLRIGASPSQRNHGVPVFETEFDRPDASHQMGLVAGGSTIATGRLTVRTDESPGVLAQWVETPDPEIRQLLTSSSFADLSRFVVTGSERGKGIFTVALAAAVNFGVSNLGVTKYALVIENGTAHRKAVERLGFGPVAENVRVRVGSCDPYLMSLHVLDMEHGASKVQFEAEAANALHKAQRHGFVGLKLAL